VNRQGSQARPGVSHTRGGRRNAPAMAPGDAIRANLASAARPYEARRSGSCRCFKEFDIATPIKWGSRGRAFWTTGSLPRPIADEYLDREGMVDSECLEFGSGFPGWVSPFAAGDVAHASSVYRPASLASASHFPAPPRYRPGGVDALSPYPGSPPSVITAIRRNKFARQEGRRRRVSVVRWRPSRKTARPGDLGLQLHLSQQRAAPGLRQNNSSNVAESASSSGTARATAWMCVRH